jgi:hypothetical protein
MSLYKVLRAQNLLSPTKLIITSFLAQYRQLTNNTVYDTHTKEMSNNPFYNNDPFNVLGLGHGADWGTRRPYDARSHSIWNPRGPQGGHPSYPRRSMSGDSMFSDVRSMGPSISYSLDPGSSYGGSWYGGSRYSGGDRHVRTPPGFPPRGSRYYGDSGGWW